MAIVPVLKIGNPVLQQIAKPVDIIDAKLRQGVIQDMLDTMEAEDGAGIAAPQIGVSLRIVIFGIDNNTKTKMDHIIVIVRFSTGPGFNSEYLICVFNNIIWLVFHYLTIAFVSVRFIH